MSDILSFGAMADLIQVLGWPGLFVYFWFVNIRDRKRSEERFETLLRTYREDTMAMKRMYENNVSLVKHYEKLATGLQDLVVMNTTAITRLVDKMECR